MKRHWLPSWRSRRHWRKIHWYDGIKVVYVDDVERKRSAELGVEVAVVAAAVVVVVVG